METRYSLISQTEHCSKFGGCSAATEEQCLKELLDTDFPWNWTVQEWINYDSEDAECVSQMNGEEWLRERGYERNDYGFAETNRTPERTGEGR